MFYDKIPEIQRSLEVSGHATTLPNSYGDPIAEERYRNLGNAEHSKWKAGMIRKSTDTINRNDAVLVLNFEKNGVENYIGGATFLEMHDAFRLGKKIFLYNDIPKGILTDEIIGFNPTIIDGHVEMVA